MWVPDVLRARSYPGRRVLVVEPIAGLCNRMRAIDGAHALALVTGHELHVRWTLRGHMPARFDTLFEPLDGVATMEQYADPPYRRLPRHAYDWLTKDCFLSNARTAALLTASYRTPELGVHRTIVVQTYDRLHRSEHPFAIFRPRAAIADRVASYGDLSRTVGVHVRRTDSAASISGSPTTGFIQAMNDAVDEDPDTMFFLATDSPEEEHLLREEFPGRIIVHPKASLARDDPAAVVDAMVDLYCLAACRMVVGSHFSTFSGTAAAIRGVPLRIARAAV